MYKIIKKNIYNRLVVPFLKVWKMIEWRIYHWRNKEINLVIGAGGTRFRNWISTDITTLDIINEEDYRKYFLKKKINMILAEHVFEHLDNHQIEKAIANFYKYSSDNVNIRIAVPDGYHADEKYLNLIKPGGSGAGAEDHKQLFNYISLASLFEKHGFKSRLVEYWDEKMEFHPGYTNDNKGYISRSFLNDERNIDGIPHYTSLIIDFFK